MSSWQRLAEDVWYRRQSFGEMQWTPAADMVINNIVVASPRGGPIAVVRDTRVWQKLKTVHASLEIFSAFGAPLSSMSWHYQGLIGMYWTPDEILVAVFEDSLVRTYNCLCEPINAFTCDSRAKHDTCHHVAFWPEGLCILTRTNKVFVNFSFSEQKCIKFADIPKASGAPLGMCVIPQDEIDVIALVGCKENTYKVTRDTCSEFPLDDAPYSSFAVSSSGDFVACLSEKGAFKVFDKQLNLLDYASFECRRPPKQIAWCGDDCVCLYFAVKTPSESWQHTLFVGGPDNEWIPYQYEEQLVLAQEIDGVRIIGKECQFLQRVAPSTESIFSIGSCEPPAMLWYALERYREGDVRAEESVGAIKEELKEAIATIIDATAYELDFEKCQRLFEAAVFGRTFAVDPPNIRDTSVAARYTPHHYVNSCKHLRIAHALRGVGMPMTVTQLQSIGMDGILDRLSIRNQHFTASRICDWLCIPRDRVLIHWAKTKIRKDVGVSDVQLCSHIVKQFTDERHGSSGVDSVKPTGNLSFASVSQVAAEFHRPVLATMLLNYEARGTAQVNTLIKLGELSIAVEKGSAHGDPDLLHRCLNSMDDVKPSCLPTKFAQDFYVSYLRKEKEFDSLKVFAENLDLPTATIIVQLAYQNTDVESRIELTKNAADAFAQEKNGAFNAAQTSEQVNLMRTQEKLEKKAVLNHWRGSPHKFVGLSLMDTVRALILINESMEADTLRMQFKVPDKRYWRRKVDGLAEAKNTTELELMAQHKNSPIGYEPFVIAMQQCGRIDLAKKIVPSVKDPETQAKLYESLGFPDEARVARTQERGGLLNMFKFG